MCIYQWVISCSINQNIEMLKQQEQPMQKIAIIGCGITGLSVAFQHPLKSAITMFDKSRRPGGRISTRVSRQHPGYSFDHGAPFIFAKGQFKNFLQEIDAVRQVDVRVKKGLGQNCETMKKVWLGGNPKIESIPLKITEKLSQMHNMTLQYETRISTITKNNQKQGYTVLSQKNKQYGPYNKVYICIPYPQCLSIKQNILQLPIISSDEQSYQSTWVVMVAFDSQSNFSLKYAQVDVITNIGEGIYSMGSQRQKGNESVHDLWVFMMDANWCKNNRNQSVQYVEKEFSGNLEALFGKDLGIKYMKAHRWLYSSPVQTPKEAQVGPNIVFGGDWVGQRKTIQEAWELGPVLYQAINQKRGNL